MLKQTLLAFSILAIAGSAAAADVTNPFYVAMKGQVGSVTTASLQRNVIKNSREYTKSNSVLALEEVQVGLSDSWAIVGSVGNTWDRWKGNWVDDTGAMRSFRDNENIQWSAGLVWNVLRDKTKWQLSAKYGQDRAKNFSGEYKYTTVGTKFGYQFQRVLPYVAGDVEFPLFQKAGVDGNLPLGNKFIYNAKAGIYQGKCEVWALDTGVRMTYNENNEMRVITAEAEASYYLTPFTTIGIFGTYALDGKAKHKSDVYDKSVGARLRMYF